MRVLIAPDKFKDALTAAQACEMIAAGLRAVRPDWTLDLCPLTDGGEGFARILTEAAGGEWLTREVTGPRGAPVRAGLGWVAVGDLPPCVRARLAGLSDSGRLAVIEMAEASGLALLGSHERDVWCTDTRGTGELIAAAMERGAQGVLIGVGGSATHDLGLGALTALGARLVTAQGDAVPGCAPRDWPTVARVELDGLKKLPPVWIACDVVNPLLGPTGAAAVYARQKGLAPEDLPRLEAETARMAGLMGASPKAVERWVHMEGAGAAGGIAFGLMATVGARLVSGYELVTDWLSLEERLAAADLVITGEGRFDESSLQGKGAGSLVRAARAKGKPVSVFAGRVELGEVVPEVAVHEFSPRGEPLAESLRLAGGRLRDRVEQVMGRGWVGGA